MAREPRHRQGRVRADAARRDAAAVRFGRSRPHRQRRAGPRLGRGGVAAGALGQTQDPVRPGERRRHRAGRAGARRLLPRPHRRAHRVHEGARRRHRARVARLDGDRRDAGLPAAGVAGRVDVLAAPLLDLEHRLLLHHAAALARGGRQAPRHERGLRPRPDLVDGRARGDAGPLPAALDRTPASRLRAPHPARLGARRRLGLLRRGDVRAPRPLWKRPGRRPRRAPLHRALGARARRARDGRSEARVGRVDGRAGGRLLRGAVGLHARRVGGGGQRHRARAGLRHLVHRRPAAARDAARRLPAPHGRERVAARLPRPAAVVRLDPARRRSARS